MGNNCIETNTEGKANDGPNESDSIMHIALRKINGSLNDVS